MLGRIFGLTLVAALAGGAYWYLDLKEKRSQLAEKQELLASSTHQFEEISGRLTASKKKLDAIIEQRSAAKEYAITQQKLTEEIAALEAKRKQLIDDFVKEVIRVRTKYKNMIIPELALLDGTVLKNVTIQEITDAEIKMAHSLGVVRVPSGNLPVSARERFRMGMSPMTLLVEEKPEPASTVAAAPAGPPPDSPTAPAVTLSQAQKDRVSQARESIQQMEVRQATLVRTKQKYVAQMQDFMEKDEAARLAGKKQPYKEIRPKITLAINAIDKELTDLSTKVVTLQIEVSDITEGRRK